MAEKNYLFRDLTDSNPHSAWTAATEAQTKDRDVQAARKKIAAALGSMMKRAKDGKTLPRKAFEKLGGKAKLTVLHSETVVPIDEKPFLVFDEQDTETVLESVKSYVEAGEADEAIRAAIDNPAPGEFEPIKKRGRGRPKKGS